MTRYIKPATFVFVFTAALPQQSVAFTFNERCNHEWQAVGEINWEQTQNRHAWAIRCRIDTAEDVACYERKGMIASYIDEYGSSEVAPLVADAPCDPAKKWRLLTLCPQGCFAASERLLFGEEWLTLPEAMQMGRTSMTGIASSSSIFDIVPEHGLEVRSYTSGEEDRPLLKFVLVDGKSLKVTQNHPMILGNGNILPACDVGIDDTLLTIEGAVAIDRIERATEGERVWNISPTSQAPWHNICIAEGFLTGSLRFQNEWADNTRRRRTMKTMPSEDVEAFVGLDGS